MSHGRTGESEYTMSETITLLDDDGYPTEAILATVRGWHGAALDLLALVRKIWQYADAGYWHQETVEDEDSLHLRPVHRFHLHTGGWSGNEDLIGALKANHVFWVLHWVRSERGGHYVFTVPFKADETAEETNFEANDQALAQARRELARLNDCAGQPSEGAIDDCNHRIERLMFARRLILKAMTRVAKMPRATAAA